MKSIIQTGIVVLLASVLCSPLYAQLRNHYDPLFEPYMKQVREASRLLTESGKAAYVDNDPVRAEKLLLRAKELDPKDTFITVALGRLYREMGRFAEAYTMYSSVIHPPEGVTSTETTRPENVLAFAMLSARFGRWKDAATYYNRSSSLLNQRNPFGLPSLPENFNINQPRPKELEAMAHLGLGRAAENRASFKHALQEYETAAKLLPGSALVRLYYGNALQRHGRHAEARRELEAAQKGGLTLKAASRRILRNQPPPEWYRHGTI